MILVLSLVVVALMVLLGRNFSRKSGKRWHQLSKFPGDYPLPLIGNALQLGFDAHEATKKLLEIWKSLGKTNFRMTVGSEDWVLLSEPEDIACLFNSTTELSKSPERNAAIKPFFGNSVSTAEGDTWRWTRKLMLPSFSVKTFTRKLEAVNTHNKRLVEILNGIQEKGPVPLYRYLRPFMFDVLCDTLMGIESNLLEDPDHKYIVATGKVTNMLTENFFSYWRNIRPIFVITQIYRDMMDIIKTMQENSRHIISQRRLKLKKLKEEIESNKKKFNVDIQKLVQSKMSEDNCLLDDFLFSKLPNGASASDEMIMNEISLACYTVSDLIIPAETTIIVYYQAMYKNENIYPEPEKFNPERFFGNIQMCAFNPFGGGPRTCIGFRFAWLAMKATLSNILRRFEVSLDPAIDEPQFSYGVVTEFKNGIHLKLKSRPNVVQRFVS